MNEDARSLAERQQQLIAMLLAENAYLKRIVYALLPGGEGVTEAEIPLLKAVAGTPAAIYSHPQPGDVYNFPIHSIPTPEQGINAEISSINKVQQGIIQANDSDRRDTDGIIQKNNSIHEPAQGINQKNTSHPLQTAGINEPNINIVRANVQRLMKSAIISSHLVTAKILIQLSANPAISLRDLRKLTGLSEDGMAKRIMAMKKAGLITRQSSPKSYLLTGKAKDLFVEKAG